MSWAGHTSRMTDYDSDRLTCRVLHFRNWSWIQNVASANRGNQLHGKRLRIWRWERPLYKFFKDRDWELAAQDKSEWDALLDDFVAFCGSK